jgi:RNA polymerase sigma-70 factor, ECF subfamily
MAGTVGRIESCVPALRRYAGALVRNRQEIDDLVHDCVLRALDRLDTLRSESEMRPWLFAIMHNLHVSRARRQRTRGIHEPLEASTAVGLSVTGKQEETLYAQDIMSAVQRLPENLRSVLILVTVEDLAYGEVSKILGIPVGTVMSRLGRARERVRRECEPEQIAGTALLK